MFLFGDFANNDGPVFAVDIDELVQLEDFSDLASLDGGKLAPKLPVRFTVNGVETTLPDFVTTHKSRTDFCREHRTRRRVLHS